MLHLCRIVLAGEGVTGSMIGIVGGGSPTAASEVRPSPYNVHAWHVACGVWRVACGVWRVACGMWHVKAHARANECAARRCRRRVSTMRLDRALTARPLCVSAVCAAQLFTDMMLGAPVAMSACLVSWCRLPRALAAACLYALRLLGGYASLGFVKSFARWFIAWWCGPIFARWEALGGATAFEERAIRRVHELESLD